METLLDRSFLIVEHLIFPDYYMFFTLRKNWKFFKEPIFFILMTLLQTPFLESLFFRV